ncbi:MULTISPECIES: glutathione S-transferase family protein [unclassified Nodularia (in: cyanobacteria)]|uniref:glutathione S-transferase family protein n=1 Tax=unclassified Nodularia (in: cyanobacteria) TaxID=2656917 RepID=UPI00187E19EE|nr:MULTISPECIES: glutathione S-transferase family protein [unclassified Nodularia (in: cyanobacteria)]MBE9200178.1 glutathione S-transferase family protein [Nodularia sp. LEGE 06071]MCC2694738.1 glutathione S-transferase family protein [Nodularia sp. LEGE 04288]
MLQFYYNRRSPIARRVWIALLEKGIPFESVMLKLDDDQFQPEFLEINPFHHIPVIVDDGFPVLESLAILDYLESKYPTPALLPTAPQDLATVRMVEMVAINELFPKVISLICESQNSPKFTQAKQHVDKILKFFTETLGDRQSHAGGDRNFFGGQQLSLADIVAGTIVPTLPNLGIPLSNYPQLNHWSEQLTKRPAWQKTALSAEEFAEFKRRVKVLVKLRQRQDSWGKRGN